MWFYIRMQVSLIIFVFVSLSLDAQKIEHFICKPADYYFLYLPAAVYVGAHLIYLYETMGERLLNASSNTNITSTTATTSAAVGATATAIGAVSNCRSSTSTSTEEIKYANRNMTHASISGGTATAARVSSQDGNHNNPLRCPRCDSPNTKFCYYNNYSLSQPRYFCKDCKRYWTRGGTLRNIPVGGGCRKNKRAKKKPPATTGMAAAVAAKSSDTDSTVLTTNNGLISSHMYDASVLFNAFRSPAPAPVDLGLTSSTEIPSCTANALDLSVFGLGFSTDYQGEEEEYELAQVQQLPVNPPPFMPTTVNENMPFGSPSSFTTKASLLVSNLKQPRKMDYCPALLPYDGLQNSMFDPEMFKGSVSSEEQINVIIKDSYSYQREIPTSANIDLPQNDSLLYWNNAAIGSGGWPDPVN